MGKAVFRTLKGMRDILPPDGEKWRRMENLLALIARLYGYREIRTPILEFADLFKKGLGDTSDVVEKEMFEFIDKDGSDVVLRPEGTAPVVRAYIEHGMASAPWVRLFYIGPMFRREKPQKGRYRQFHQFGVEFFGVPSAAADVEVMAMLSRVMKVFGVEGYLKYNNIGCKICRPKYIEFLRQEIDRKMEDIPSEYHLKIRRNPMRIFDIKDERLEPILQSLPKIGEYLCDDCRKHASELGNLLEVLGLDVTLDERLVRGFDYYTRTVFEYISPHLGAKSAVAGGGRYDYLVSYYGGPDVPGVGFGIGLERLLMAVEDKVPPLSVIEPVSEIMVVYTHASLIPHAMEIAEQLRDSWISVVVDLRGVSLRAQMKAASKHGYKWVLIVGEDELTTGRYKLRDMESGEEKLLRASEIVTLLDGRGE